MGIQLKQLRVHGFRGLDNLEIDFEPTTVLVGTNNAGKTTLLKSLQLALSNTLQITDDDFHFSDVVIRDKIIIDILFTSIDAEGNPVSEFEDKWATVFTTERISFDADGNQFLAFRTVIKENLIRKTYKKKQYVIDEWGDFQDETEGFWHQKEYENELSFYFDEIPFFYLDANRDILDDLKSKTSFLGKILSSIAYDQADKELIENLIKDLNKETIDRSEILTNLHSTLEELDTAMDNPQNTVDITPFTKKIRDLNKGVKINYSQFSMEYHGMGTRSWSSLLILKAFILQNQSLAESSQVAYYPIIAIEEPESHLHPNAQKKLYSQIKNIVGQRIIATHSSYIAGSAKLKEVRSINKITSNISIGKFLESDFESEDIRKIYRQVINTRGELFFSKLVILFEGETEEQALPITIKRHLNKNPIELGVDFIGVGGSGNYLPFIRFFEAFNVPYLIFSDNEAEANAIVTNQIAKSKLNDINKVVFLNTGNDFEKELCDNGYIEEVKKAYYHLILSECANEHHKEAKKAELDQIPEADYYNLVTSLKTQFAPVIGYELYKSDKPLPPKIVELFDKVNLIINPTENAAN
ncbi:AAA family ATPase [Leeuwenhoekiella palythoae]|uniref:ATP-dependent endonuclease of OLD family n=1 Tax=Leeuwenhoekiella palythoae TaxID=573501 RepID=A0A1M5WNG3_9FLAO|nr:AAA family ATPase [Leeuwenhoekiella palythoae]RXG31426.1 putative ATP-dependent endonuclease of OLD family [Leeuwenhoekiella palythoae]SHH88523.1 putative ATP-dependent endonuclease of the OLD family [Leeuwenhoekiella palythoae]